MAVVALLTAGSASGCAKQKLSDVAVPEGGMKLRYELAAGRTLVGHVKVRDSAQTPLGELVNRLEYDLTLTVVEPVADGFAVDASVANVVFNQRIPDGLPAKALDEQGFNAATADAINGLVMRVVMTEHGDVTDVPEPPAEANLGLTAMLGMVLAGVQAGLVRVPPELVKAGDTWDAVDLKRLEEGETAQGSGTFVSLGQDAAGTELAQLEHEYERTGTHKTPIGVVEFKSRAKLQTRFDVGKGYPTQVKGQISREARGQTAVTEIEAEWSLAQ